MSTDLTTQEDKYYVKAEEIKIANDLPLISKIKIGNSQFDITSPKDWSENRQASRAYIYGRTHYVEPKIFENSADIPVISKSFINTYTEIGNLQTTDYWQIQEPWFSVDSQGKLYTVTLQIGERSQTREWELNSNKPLITLTDWSEFSGTKSASVKVRFKPDTFTFYLEDEGSAVKTAEEGGDTIYPRSVPNSLSISPCLYDSKNADRTSYEYRVKLHAKYIPVDNKTIRQTTSGVLATDELFDEDFQLSKDFGKYPAKSYVSAKGKTLREIFKEAFCEDLRPAVLYGPSINFEAVPEISSGIYEVGAEATLNWSLKFNPGKYSYGTVGKNNSNIYISKFHFATTETDATELVYPTMDVECAQASKDTSINGYISFKPEDGASCFTPGGIITDQNVPYLVANGTIKIEKVEPGENGQAQIAVKYLRSTDSAATSLGVVAEPKVYIVIKNDSVDQDEQNEFDAIQRSGPIRGEYRWFWGTNEEVNGATADVKPNQRSDFNLSASLLGAFPEKITTFKAQSFFFAAPAGMVKPNEFKVLNARTGASAGIIHKDEQSLKIVDASGRDEHLYDLFYIINDVADSGTQTYEIQYTLNTGGNS